MLLSSLFVFVTLITHIVNLRDTQVRVCYRERAEIRTIYHIHMYDCFCAHVIYYLSPLTCSFVQRCSRALILMGNYDVTIGRVFLSVKGRRNARH